MTRTGWIIGGLAFAVAVLLAILAFMIGRATVESSGTTVNTATNSTTAPGPAPILPGNVSGNVSAPAPPTPPPKQAGPDAATGPAYSERFEEPDVTLRFVPTARFRRLIEYRMPAFSQAEDPSCTAAYSTSERVTHVEYAWELVIERFWTFSEREGQHEYMAHESALPNAWQGSLNDIVRQGRTVRITKQRCGQGQVASLVAVRP